MSPRNSSYPLIVIVGPTASGKSDLALTLAERLQGEIVNYDSVQIYRGCDVGAGKVPLRGRRGVPHHLLDWADASEAVTAGDYAREAEILLAGIRSRRKCPILVGGTGFYLRALLGGLFQGPRRSEALRERLRSMSNRRGREFLHRMLQRFDPTAAARINPRDEQKRIRALEVCILTRQPLSQLQAQGGRGLQGFQAVKIGLNPGRRELYARINQRVERMFAEGLLEEARVMLARPDAARLKPLEALGYRQAAGFLRGELSLEDAIRRTQIETRHYAKRQMTWFRREPEVTWFAGFGDEPGIQNRVLVYLGEVLSAVPAASNSPCGHE